MLDLSRNIPPSPTPEKKKKKRASGGEICSSGWETPAGWRHAAYVSWAVNARCHWLEPRRRRLRWERGEQESEHPPATASHHWPIRGIRHRFTRSSSCRDFFFCHRLSGRFPVEAWAVGIYIIPIFFFSLILQMWAAGWNEGPVCVCV